MRSSRVKAEAGDEVTATLLDMLAQLTTHATTPTATPAAGAARIDRIAALEHLRGALAAAQHTEMVAFARDQVAQHLAQIETGGLDPAAVGRGIADQIALACKISPFHGSRRLGIARALDVDLPHAAALLAAGRISERVAEMVVSQTSHLDGEQRRSVDKQLSDSALEELSVRRAEAVVKRCAYDTDPAGYVARGRTARSDRRVGCARRRTP